MKNLRLILPSLLMAGLMASGCWLVSGQFTVSADLPDPLNVTSPVNLASAQIDLNTETRLASELIADLLGRRGDEYPLALPHRSVLVDDQPSEGVTVHTARVVERRGQEIPSFLLPEELARVARIRVPCDNPPVFVA